MLSTNEECAVIVKKTQAVLADYLQNPLTSKQDALAKLLDIYDGPEHRDTVKAVQKRAHAQHPNEVTDEACPDCLAA